MNYLKNSVLIKMKMTFLNSNQSTRHDHLGHTPKTKSKPMVFKKTGSGADGGCELGGESLNISKDT
ncbi:Protein of unknown function [Gryllus bimaculatus]|nr:Protein of unknown function [Gryllus bimaculatus]